MTSYTLARLHALRCYLLATRHGYRRNIFAATLTGQDVLVKVARQSLRQTRHMERLLDQIIKEIKEVTP